MNIVGLNGSPNKEGNTSFLVNKVLEECSIRGAQTIILNVGKIMAEQKNSFCTDDCGHQGLCATRPAREDENAIKRAVISAKRLVEVCKATDGIRIR